MNKLLLIIVLALPLILLDNCLVGAEPSKEEQGVVLDRILADWKVRQTAIQTIRYRAKGEHLAINGSVLGKDATGQSNVENYRFPVTLSWLIDFKNNRMKKDSSQRYPSGRELQWMPRIDSFYYDGEKYKHYLPEDENGPLPRTVANLAECEIDPITFIVATDVPVFLSHGSIPTDTALPKPSRLLVPLSKNCFEYRGTGVMEETECVILRSRNGPDNGNYEYWVDTSRQSALLRFTILLPQSRPRMSVDLRYSQTEVGWLPKSWTTTLYEAGGSGAIEWVDEMNDVKIDLNPEVTKQDFRIEACPGMRLEFYNKKGLFQINAEGSLSELVIADGKTSERRRPLWQIYLVIIGCALCLLISLQIARKFRRKSLV